jgi:hypothetical protein
MRHYSARQRVDGKWDYTCGNYPVGYCAEYKEWTQEELDRYHFRADCPSLKKAAEFKDKHHTCGHDTEVKAQECYRQFMLDQSMSYGRKSSDAQYKCKVCGEWTQFFAMCNTRLWTLCEKHNNREEVEKLFGSVGEMWIS